MKSETKRACGFTLLELLVVVGIIGVLAAVLLPVLARVRENARRSSCQSNLQQIGVAIAQYTQDHDGIYPPNNYNPHDPNAVGWAFLIQPYARNTQILQCPDEETAPDPAPSAPGYTDYTANVCLLGLHETSLLSPANSILALDGIRFNSTSLETGHDGTSFNCRGDSTRSGAMPGKALWLSRPNEPSIFRYGDRHLQGANYVFADSHVKFLLPTAVYNSCTAPSANATFAFK